MKRPVAIIPARGGSKRIPRKNIKPFCGRPMIAWSIAAAQSSGLFDAVIVSTDDEEIAEVSKKFGAEVPFVRPSEIANDHATTMAVMAHAVRWLNEHRGAVDMACCIYPTAPFLLPEYLRAGLALLLADPEAHFAFSVTTYAFPIFRALRVDAQGRVAMFWPENQEVRSQDLPVACHDAGQFYWGRGDAFLNQSGIFTSVSLPVRIPRHLVQDIDEPEDWEMAERMMPSAVLAGVPGV
jgi:pseudaminic acid cytidylyltransferase